VTRPEVLGTSSEPLYGQTLRETYQIKNQIAWDEAKQGEENCVEDKVRVSFQGLLDAFTSLPLNAVDGALELGRGTESATSAAAAEQDEMYRVQNTHLSMALMGEETV
jgi:hypothetical protein